MAVVAGEYGVKDDIGCIGDVDNNDVTGVLLLPAPYSPPPYEGSSILGVVAGEYGVKDDLGCNVNGDIDSDDLAGVVAVVVLIPPSSLDMVTGEYDVKDDVLREAVDRHCRPRR